MDTVFSIILGLGLATACGFRVFVPMLLLSIGAQAGAISLSTEFLWIASTPALIAFAAATVLEILGYFIPWVDNVLDSVTTPAAVIAGIMVTAAAVTDMPTFAKWTLAIIAGGGISGLVQAGTGAVRAASTATTGGIGNHVLASAEIGGSLAISGASILVPLVGALLASASIILASVVLSKGRQVLRSWIP